MYILTEKKYFTSDKMANGFVKCGQHVKHTKPGESTVNFPLMMQQWMGEYRELDDELMDLLVQKKPAVVQELIRTGNICNEFLDSLGIPRTEGAVDRDNLTICRQNAFLVTHEDSIARYRQRQNE